MKRHTNLLLIIIFTLFSFNSLEGRKIKLKGTESSNDNSTSTFGDKNFESRLEIFWNSENKNDKTNKYYGWETNNNITPSGNPNAIKGGMFTMLGGDEYPTTFRSLGKDSRSQINGLMDALQNEPLLAFDYENLEWYPVIASHWKIEDDSLTYWFRIDPKAKWADGRDIISEDVVAAFKLHTDDGHEDPNVATYYNDLFHIPEVISKYIVKIKAKKIDWRSFRAAAAMYPMPSFYLNKIDGAGYIEKYNFSFLPGSGAYMYDAENSKKGAEGYIIFKRRSN